MLSSPLLVRQDRLANSSQSTDDDTPPLVKDLSFIVRPGEHLMITGSNGVGKTAIARVLAGLWRPTPSSSESEVDSGSGSGISLKTSGTSAVYTPQNAHDRHHPSVFVVPQRAYMVVGSLLDQVIYPHTYQEFIKSGRTIDELEDILEKVFLTYLPDREGGWTTRKEWRDVLSGGEKQRVSFVVIRFRPRVLNIDLDEFGSCLLSSTQVCDIG